MAYTLTFSGDMYPDTSVTVNNVAATSGMEIKNGDVIVFYTGINKVGTTRTGYEAKMNGVTYAYNSTSSTETVTKRNISIIFSSASVFSTEGAPVAHTVNFVAGEKRCTVSYGSQTLKTFSEAQMQSGSVSLKCAGKLASENIKVKFEEV